MQNLGLRGKQMVISLLFGLIPFVIISTVSISYIFSMLKNERDVASYYNTQNVANTLDSTIINFSEMTQFLIGNEYIREFLASGDLIGTSLYNNIYNNAYNVLILLPFGSKAFNTVGVFSQDGRAIISGANGLMKITDLEMKEAQELKGDWFWSIDNNGLSISRLLRDKSDLSIHLGYIKISIDEKALKKLFVSTEYWPNASFILYDIKRNCILLDDLDDQQKGIFEENNMNLEHLLANDKNSFVIAHNGEKYSIMTWRLCNNKTLLISIIPDLGADYHKMIINILFSACLLFAAWWILQLWLSDRWVIHPLKKLGSLMKSIESEDFTVRFDQKGNDEIALLAKQFNLMSDKLQFLYKEVYSSKLKMKDAQIKALQSEINPHFLFNTLNIIYWMVTMGDTASAGKMIKSLSDLFRISLYRTTNGLIPLSVEIEHIKSYLTIQQMRFRDNLVYSIELQEGLSDLSVVNLVLQPLVENAVLHGIEPKQRGEVIVSVYISDDTLFYSIYDNGIGADPKVIDHYLNNENTGQEHGLALRNVNERIKLKFGNDFGLIYNSPADGGSVFIVKQPIIRGKGDCTDD